MIDATKMEMLSKDLVCRLKRAGLEFVTTYNDFVSHEDLVNVTIVTFEGFLADMYKTFYNVELEIKHIPASGEDCMVTRKYNDN